MAIFGGVGGAQSFSSASGGKTYAYNNISTVQIQVAPANPARQMITFHNPGDVDIFVYPGFNAAGQNLLPSINALGGALRVLAFGGTYQVTGECQFGWGAFSASGENKPLTVMDSNV